MNSNSGFSVMFLAALLAGCAVGPDFKKPAPPPVTRYTPVPFSNTTAATNVPGGEPQHFVAGEDIAGNWWTLFHSKPLNALIERSIKANPNLKAAQAALRVAQENAKAQRGAYYPTVAGSFSAARERTAGELAPIPNANEFNFSLYTPELTVAYAPDVFGLNRRTVESLNAQTEQARFAVAATYITLTANVVAAAIQEAALRAEVEAAHQLIGASSNMLQIVRAQFAKGYASRIEVAAQESQLAQVAATLPPLVKQLAQQRDLLSVLAGSFPGEDLPEKFELSQMQLPVELPLSLPSSLVEQRPDVRQAEENMRAASAQIGIAVANRLPNFLLSADVGSMALQAGRMFSSGTGFWTLAGSVTQPLFQGGALLHKQRAARAAFTNATEQYRATVLTAFQNVADTLHALQQDGEALRTAAVARDAANVTFELSKQQWQAGYAGYLSLLNGESAYNLAVINLIQAQANRYADTAALFQALGGGWWNTTLTQK